jgi:hypothetical protein
VRGGNHRGLYVFGARGAALVWQSVNGPDQHDRERGCIVIAKFAFDVDDAI